MSKIEEALKKKFRSNRIVFWYDEKQELLHEFDNLVLEDVTKVHVDNNEFEVKYLVTKAKSQGKFLLYFSSAKPSNEENWLLDLELAYCTFHTDQEAMFLQEIGLGYHLKELVVEHSDFFKSKERRTKLKELLGDGDEHEEIRGKMLAVVFNTDFVNINTFIQAHASCFVENDFTIEKHLDRYNLSNFYWDKIRKQYNYNSEEPSIYDFLVEVFNNNFSYGDRNNLSKESRVLLLLWKDTLQFREGFKSLSSKIAGDIDVASKIEGADLDVIIEDDLFELCDLKIIHSLNQSVVNEMIALEKVKGYIKKRENKFWYNKFEDFYSSVLIAVEFIDLAKKFTNRKYENFSEGTSDYAVKLYEVDLLYRKFIWHYKRTNQNRLLSDLADKVEKIYSNDWLLTYNNNWQINIDNLDNWPSNNEKSQRKFFQTYVQPFLDKKQRVFVVISDALRFECGAELNKRLQNEKRYVSEIDYMFGSLPTYTQLGMASILPHKQLSFKKGTDSILVNNVSSTGIQGRTKVLSENLDGRAVAISAEEFMNFNAKTDGREFVKQNDVIYIYHNRIDKTGDDKISESKVFEAVEEELEYLVDVLKKISNMNGNNMIITSDHGFIYQHQPLSESDFIVSNHTGDIWKENRRFVIGESLKGDSKTKFFNGRDLGIDSDVDVLIPKSINRLKVKGAGSRFVHGGATLQEIVVPVISVSKKRKDTTDLVDIDIIKSTDRITTNILAVSFIQTNLVTDKILPRQIEVAFYAGDGTLLSDIFKYNFNIDEGIARQREVKHRFQLMSKASGKYKNQRVKLILKEPIDGTNKWKPYKEFYYTLNISFTNDFDDF